ncbi:hypothetical protein [Streptomyces piniterrae]|uniref:hypothetical protein n=1 Tax=Streptomyces piniterrae TaxID=2571125 RepID=UPI00145DCA72|nr:hypothetical protein [Streptomyces piniterrae]
MYRSVDLLCCLGGVGCLDLEKMSGKLLSRPLDQTGIDSYRLQANENEHRSRRS